MISLPQNFLLSPFSTHPLSIPLSFSSQISFLQSIFFSLKLSFFSLAHPSLFLSISFPLSLVHSRSIPLTLSIAVPLSLFLSPLGVLSFTLPFTRDSAHLLSLPLLLFIFLYFPLLHSINYPISSSIPNPLSFLCKLIPFL